MEFIKVMQCTIENETWDKLKSIYKGDEKVKKAKLQTLSLQFKMLKMKEEEDIAT